MEGNAELIARVSFDLIIICIFALSAILGWRKGLGAVIFSTFRWLICVAVSVISAYPVKDFLIKNTETYNNIYSHLETTLTSPLTGNAFFDALPVQTRSVYTEYTVDAAKKVAATLADTTMLVLSFLLVLLVLLIITKLLLILLENKDKDDPIGFINGFLGFCFGAVRGIIILCILMLLFFPLLTVIDPEAVSPVVSGIRQSYIAGLLYDHNPISMFFDMF